MEQEQFKKEVLPLRGQLQAYALRLLGDKNDAEDIIQEVFLKLWYMRNELPQYNSVSALSVKITKHLCLNRLNANQRHWEDFDDVILTDENLSPHYQLEQKDQIEQVLCIIDQLPGLQQTILRMKHVEGFEIEEIAGITGSNAEAVRMNLSRARKKVKDIFLKIEKK
ncbi:DNA-directed RNA polymerase sigma-70 factor [Bacteroidia bacterium]|nr:DNA-directed RNA polymerase sigma-70 factor [Bacteroidia bacterium]